MSEDLLDVAIVGGGVSGVYSAWRLLAAGVERRISLFEADDHIGGRLLSVVPPKIPQMTAELGGMRILPEVQPRVTQLIASLNREVDPANRIETYPFPVDQPANISYLRGVHLRLSDFAEHPEKVPYRLNFQEIGETAGEQVLDAIAQVVPGITDPTLSEEERRQMARRARFAGRPLYRQGFWQVLLRVMSGEAYQLAIAAGGYQTTLSNWNAADAIPWFLSDFGIAPKYEGFKRGFQQVPLRVAEEVRKAGGEIHLESPVLGFEATDDGVVLRLVDGTRVRARRLILAMPRRSLELLAPQSPLLRDARVSALVRSVTPRPLFKLFTTYLEPWWLPAGVSKGRSTTDLPVRQTYYWPNTDGEPCLGGRAMLMASYDDGLNIGFWDGFRPKRRPKWDDDEEGVETQAPSLFSGTVDETGEEFGEWHENRAPRVMVAEIQRQLAEIHGLKYVPEVENASFKDWGDDPYGGGWNSWNIGVKSWKVRDAILQPQPPLPVYICGEAYSYAQGWVEGALETADSMLHRHFGIEPL